MKILALVCTLPVSVISLPDVTDCGDYVTRETCLENEECGFTWDTKVCMKWEDFPCSGYQRQVECNVVPECLFSQLSLKCEDKATVACDAIKFPKACSEQPGCGFSDVSDSCDLKATMTCSELNHMTCRVTPECYLYKRSDVCVALPTDNGAVVATGSSEPDSCPRGFQPITIAHECFVAASRLGKGWQSSITAKTWGATGVCTLIQDSPSNPAANDKLYFGEIGTSDENKRSHHTLVCEKAPPTPEPTPVPTEPTATPTEMPTTEPTAIPTEMPTTEPTATPTEMPTTEPTASPTEMPTTEPTATPTEMPTPEPIAEVSCTKLSTVEENNFNDRGNNFLDRDTTYEYTSSCGYPIKLTGWNVSRVWGFLRSLPGSASAVVEGLTPGNVYKYLLYQYGNPIASNPYYVNGVFGGDTLGNKVGTPTGEGLATADSNGRVTFTFTKDGMAVSLSGIAIAQADRRRIPSEHLPAPESSSAADEMPANGDLDEQHAAVIRRMGTMPSEEAKLMPSEEAKLMPREEAKLKSFGAAGSDEES